MIARTFRIVAILLLLAGALTQVPDTAGQELITIVDDQSATVSRFQGQVLAWDSERLTYENAGREREIAARRVIAVDYAKTPGQQQADDFFESGRFDQAALAYEQGLSDESRPWVLEEMHARMLRCAAATGKIEQAVDQYLKILQSSPKSRFSAQIPLAWHFRQRAAGPFALELRTWLEGNDPLRGLIAASWLLVSDEEAASRRLRELQINGERQTAQLAAAQLWRGQLVTAGNDDLRRWQLAIERMPESLQAGPRYLAAMVQKRLRPDARSVVAFLQIPILFPEQYQVCGEALSEAGSLLHSLGREDDAAIVERELQTSYGFSASALRTQKPMEQFDK